MSNDIPASENPLNSGHQSPPPAVMMITLLLLISTLLLTGFMMMYYSRTYKEQAPNSVANETSSSDLPPNPLTKLLPKKDNEQTSGTSISSEHSDSQSEEKNGMINQLFGTKTDSVRWPKMKLTGFGTSADGTGGFAIINNHKYNTGQLIGGKVRLIEVRKYDVLLEMSGETNTLTVGMNN
ncbi:hypothetical protein P4E94_16840 [Pontiellaceae bacterium B12219]|nr:hypothetical protein [Pontiellaceae bacterium B12219]